MKTSFLSLFLPFLSPGVVGITLHPVLSEASNPFDPNHGDSEFRSNEFSFGLFADPVVLTGDFSDQVKIEADQNLLPFTDKEKRLLRGRSPAVRLQGEGQDKVSLKAWTSRDSASF